MLALPYTICHNFHNQKQDDVPKQEIFSGIIDAFFVKMITKLFDQKSKSKEPWRAYQLSDKRSKEQGYGTGFNFAVSKSDKKKFLVLSYKLFGTVDKLNVEKY